VIDNNLGGKFNQYPKVSIIIPNYNYARFLDERFRSILNQSYKDYEIIFLDDASTDDSVAQVEGCFGEYIQQVEVNTTNSGNPFVQWNRGVRRAKGKFVWIAEADDTCTPDFLERMVHAMDNNPSIGLAYCNTTPIDAVGAVIDDGFFHRYVSDLDANRWLHDFSGHGLSEVKNFLARKNTITNVSGVLFRRDVFIRAGFAPENMRMCGDWLAYCRVLHESDVAYIAAPMNFHRQHPTKHTQNSVLNLTYFREYLQVQQFVAKAFNQNVCEKKAAFHRFLGEWDRLTISNYGRIGLSRTVDLARMAVKSYPGMGCQIEIAAHLVFNSSKSLAGKWLRN
jgi:glycosyltransferase involved in cell wall biosynthesis